MMSARVRFCNWFGETVCSGEVEPFLTYFTDEVTETVTEILKISDIGQWIQPD